MISLIQDFVADFLLNSGLNLKTFTHHFVFLWGSKVELSNFILANRYDPDEMPPLYGISSGSALFDKVHVYRHPE